MAHDWNSKSTKLKRAHIKSRFFILRCVRFGKHLTQLHLRKRRRSSYNFRSLTLSYAIEIQAPSDSVVLRVDPFVNHAGIYMCEINLTKNQPTTKQSYCERTFVPVVPIRFSWFSHSKGNRISMSRMLPSLCETIHNTTIISHLEYSERVRYPDKVSNLSHLYWDPIASRYLIVAIVNCVGCTDSIDS